jgi:quercetin dioxygenase-like cupin family protein
MDTQANVQEFHAGLKRDGYQEVEKKTVPANFLSKPHTHEFDVCLLILEGQLTLTRDGKSDTYRAGETFRMDAGCLHTEQYGPSPTTYLVGRRRK